MLYICLVYKNGQVTITIVKMFCKLLYIIQGILMYNFNFLALPGIKVFGHLLPFSYNAASDWHRFLQPCSV